MQKTPLRDPEMMGNSIEATPIASPQSLKDVFKANLKTYTPNLILVQHGLLRANQLVQQLIRQMSQAAQTNDSAHYPQPAQGPSYLNQTHSNKPQSFHSTQVQPAWSGSAFHQQSSPFGAASTYSSNHAISHHQPSICIPSVQGQMREVTVVFSDIRGYTTLVEQYPAHIVIQQLNTYFSALTEVIFQHHGRVDKYLGDGLLAYFEPTDGQMASSAQNAIRSVKAMYQTLEVLNQRWAAENLPQLSMGAGVNSGVVYLGNIGSQMKMDLTIIGDNVNLASRLEQLNKTYKTKVILSGSTHQWIQHHHATRLLGKVNIRGKKIPYSLYELLLT